MKSKIVIALLFLSCIGCASSPDPVMQWRKEWQAKISRVERYGLEAAGDAPGDPSQANPYGTSVSVPVDYGSGAIWSISQISIGVRNAHPCRGGRK